LHLWKAACGPCTGAMLLASLLMPGVASPGQTAAGAADLVGIRVERKLGDRIERMPAKKVFENGDVLRFQLSSSMAGYLYVIDKGTTGSVATLFPGAGSLPGDNRIEPAHTYLVPADGDGWFEVSGPAGFDLLYFLVSATPIRLPSAAAPQPQSGDETNPERATVPGLLPRCNDAIFKSRGDCLDDSAGVSPLPGNAELPREMAPLAGYASRDIILSDDSGGTTVKAAKLPMIYTFRLAHH
jgi:uncharacterized protein DUF4384